MSNLQIAPSTRQRFLRATALSLALALPVVTAAPREANADKIVIELAVLRKNAAPDTTTWTFPMFAAPNADATLRDRKANIYIRRIDDAMTLEVEAPTVPLTLRLKSSLASLLKAPAVTEVAGAYRLQWRVVP